MTVIFDWYLMDFFSLTELTVCETSEAKTRKMETYFFMRKIYASILLKAQYIDLYGWMYFHFNNYDWYEPCDMWHVPY